MTMLKRLGAVAVLCGGLVSTASALPVAPIPSDAPSAGIEQVRWVCGPYRCWWRPNYYGGYRAYGYYRRPYWGWRHRHWRRW